MLNKKEKIVDTNLPNFIIKDQLLKLNIDINKEFGINVIDNQHNVIWVNDFYKKKFGSKIIGKKCYRYIKKFDKPCSWCPHSEVIINKSIYTKISPSEHSDCKNNLAHYQLISLPLKYDSNNNVELIVELLIDYNKQAQDIIVNRKRIYSYSQRIFRLIQIISTDNIPVLLLFSLVWETFLKFNEAEIIFYDNESNLHNPLVLSSVSFSKNQIDSKLEKQFLELLYGKVKDAGEESRNKQEINRHELDLFIGIIKNRITEKVGINVPFSQFDPRVNILFNSISPQRLDLNRIGIVPPSPYANKGMAIIVKNTEKNSYLMDDQYSDFTLFMASINDLLHSKTIVTNLNIAISNINYLVNQNQEKENFLVHAAPYAYGKVHDLRGVYKNLLDKIDTLKGLKLSGIGNTQTNNIQKSIKALIDGLSKDTKLFDQILFSMKTLDSMTTPTLREIKLLKVLNELQENNLLKLKERKIELQIDVSTEIDLKADVTLLMQILQNLLENSIRAFVSVQRPKKFIHINAFQEDDHIKMLFIDNACGISPELTDLIWNMYYSTRNQGTGLGLYFVKFLVEKVFKGSISVSSDWGEGTIFIISIPQKTAKKQ